MRVVSVKPNEKAEIIEMDLTLKNMQNFVGGYIEAIYPFEDAVALICNDEGKINGSLPNRCLFDTDNKTVIDVLFDNFLVVGLTEEDFGGLSEELAEKYRKLFETREVFTMGSNGLVVYRESEETVEMIALK